MTRKKVERKDGKRSIGLRINTELYDALTTYCKEEGYTKSGFIEKLVKNELAKQKITTDER